MYSSRKQQIVCIASSKIGYNRQKTKKNYEKIQIPTYSNMRQAIATNAQHTGMKARVKKGPAMVSWSHPQAEK